MVITDSLALFAWLKYNVSTASAASATIISYYTVLTMKNAKDREIKLKERDCIALEDKSLRDSNIEISKFHYQLEKEGLNEAEINRYVKFTA